MPFFRPTWKRAGRVLLPGSWPAGVGAYTGPKRGRLGMGVLGAVTAVRRVLSGGTTGTASSWRGAGAGRAGGGRRQGGGAAQLARALVLGAGPGGPQQHPQQGQI